MTSLNEQLLQLQPNLQNHLNKVTTPACIYRGVQDYLITLPYQERQKFLAQARNLLPSELYNTWSYRTASSECLNVYDAYRNYKEGNTSFQVSKSLEIEEYLAYQDLTDFIGQYFKQLPSSPFKQLINVVPVEQLKSCLHLNKQFPNHLDALAKHLTPERLAECNPTKIVADLFSKSATSMKQSSDLDSILKETIDNVDCAAIPQIATYMDPKEWTFDAMAARYQTPQRFVTSVPVEKMMRHFYPNHLELYHSMNTDIEINVDDFLAQPDWHLQPSIDIEQCNNVQRNTLFHGIIKCISQQIMVHPSYYTTLLTVLKKAAQPENREKNTALFQNLSSRLFGPNILYTGWSMINLGICGPSRISYHLRHEMKDSVLQTFIPLTQLEILKHLFKVPSTLTDKQKQTADNLAALLVPTQPIGLDYMHAAEHIEKNLDTPIYCEEVTISF